MADGCDLYSSSRTHGMVYRREIKFRPSSFRLPFFIRLSSEADNRGGIPVAGGESLLCDRAQFGRRLGGAGRINPGDDRFSLGRGVGQDTDV